MVNASRCKAETPSINILYMSIYESSLGVTWPLSRPNLSAMWHGLGLGLGATWVMWFNHSETQS